jgi:hypothetical protein
MNYTYCCMLAGFKEMTYQVATCRLIAKFGCALARGFGNVPANACY